MKILLCVLILISVCIAQDFAVEHTSIVYPGSVTIERKGDVLLVSFPPDLISTLDYNPTVEEFELSDSFYKAIGMEWNPSGFAPEGVWTYPSFSFYFYTMSSSDRDRAQCSSFPPCPEDATSSAIYADIDPENIPDEYAVDSLSGAPKKGIHVIWESDPQLLVEKPNEWQEATFVYGFIDGELSFLLPVVTRALFGSKQTWSRSVLQPAVYPASGEYPTEYKVSWDSKNALHRLELRGLVSRTQGEVGGVQDESSAPFLQIGFALLIVALMM